MKIAKFWHENLPAAKAWRMLAHMPATRFIVHVFYRTKWGRLGHVWNNFETLAEAKEFAARESYTTKGGYRIEFDSNNHKRVGYIITGDPYDEGTYQLISWLLPRGVSALLNEK